jgi:hypothetical protein
MNQETKWVLLMKKNRSQKSRASVPLRENMKVVNRKEGKCKRKQKNKEK